MQHLIKKHVLHYQIDVIGKQSQHQEHQNKYVQLKRAKCKLMELVQDFTIGQKQLIQYVVMIQRVNVLHKILQH